MENPIYELVLPGPSETQIAQTRDEMHALRNQIYYKKLEKEYAEFLERMAYVKANCHRLIGRKIPVEVYAIQNVDTHNCILVDDLLLLPYDEVKDILDDMDWEAERVGNQELALYRDISTVKLRKFLDKLSGPEIGKLRDIAQGMLDDREQKRAKVWGKIGQAPKQKTIEGKTDERSDV